VTPSPPPASPSQVRGRYAPSPTGEIHLGNARTALAAWLSVRSQGGTFVWRVEDLDGPRTVPFLAERQMADLAWLGLDWDEGPDVGGPHAPYHQSQRAPLYEAALERLAATGRLFPCRRSRKDLQGLASAPHGPEGAPYPAAFRPDGLQADWYEHRGAFADAAFRFRVGEEEVRFEDAIFGLQAERVDQTVGDFVLKRRDGLYAYQLAVVVDDLEMGITEVVRGADLLASTARQIQLLEALGGRRPRYAHIPLVVSAGGEKLSKRDGAVTLAALRTAGRAPEEVAGVLAHSLGLLPAPAPVAPAGLVARFSWGSVPHDAWRLSPLLAASPIASL
jgi:glutamyl-tRNA synthetase